MKDTTKSFFIALIVQVARQLISKLKGGKGNGGK